MEEILCHNMEKRAKVFEYSHLQKSLDNLVEFLFFLKKNSLNK